MTIVCTFPRAISPNDTYAMYSLNPIAAPIPIITKAPNDTPRAIANTVSEIQLKCFHLLF